MMLNDRSALSPLSKDFDTGLKSIQSQLESYKAEQVELHNRIDSLSAENARLNQQLKNALSSQMESAGVGDSMGSEDGTLGNLQRQLSLAIQEKDDAVAMWQVSVAEIDKLERQLKMARLDPQVQQLEFEAQQIKDQYVKSAAIMTQQTDHLQRELKKTKKDLEVSTVQVTELRNALEEMRSEMIRKEQQRQMAENGQTAVQRKLKDTDRQISDLNSQIIAYKLEVDQLRSDKVILERQVNELNIKSTDAENHSSEAVNKLRDSLQMVENALVERDEALVKQKQASEEITRLQEALSKLLDEAGVRTRQEVDAVKKQCNANLSKLVDEVQRLELESCERQAQADRLLREKQAVENELERVYKEGIVQGGRDTLEYNDIMIRACNAERNYDEAQVKIESLSNQIRRMESTHSQEVRRFELELESLRDRYKVTSDEFASTNEDRVKLTETVDELRQQLHSVRQEKDSTHRTSLKQIAILNQDLQVKAKEYEVKLQAMQDSHRKAVLELREIITVNQRMSTKWKEECNSITKKMEQKLSDTLEKLSIECRRNEELTRLLQDCRRKTVEMEAKMQQYARNLVEMEKQFAITEQHSASPVGGIHKHTSVHRSSTQSLSDARRKQRREFESSLRLPLTSFNSEELG